MTAVNIKGGFSKDERPANGLEAVAADIVRDELKRWVVIGLVELHKVVKVPGQAPSPTVRFVAVEPLLEADAAEQGSQMLDQARKLRGLGLVEDTLFDAPSDELRGQEGSPGDAAPAAEFSDADGPGSVTRPDEWLDDAVTPPPATTRKPRVRKPKDE